MQFKLFVSALLGAALVYGIAASGRNTEKYIEVTNPSVILFSPNSNQTDPSKIRLCRAADSLRIRVLILRHTTEQMAVSDANLVINGVNKAKSAGLDIQVVGNHVVQKIESSFVSEQMKIDASPGDTFIVYTVGHGGPNGGLQNLGPRSGVMKALSDAAAENSQETLWWQLSCYAKASLPTIDSLPSDQQEYFATVASSPANQLSWSGVQGVIMSKLFMAMAEPSSGLDANKDDVITANELRFFLDTVDGDHRGKLFDAASDNEVIFGDSSFFAGFPIIDLSGANRQYPKGYIPTR